MKKRMILLIVIMLLIIGGCNNQANQPSGELNGSHNTSKLEQQGHVQDTNSNTTDQSDGNNLNGEIDHKEEESTSESRNIDGNEVASKNQAIDENEIINSQDDNSPNDNNDSYSSIENNTNQSTNELQKQVWLRYVLPGYIPDEMINITDFPNWKLNSISYQDFIKKYFSDKDLLEEIRKEDYDVRITPSSDYLMLKLPKEYKKYINYDIVTSAKKKFPNIETYLNTLYGLGSTGPIYYVVYSIKQQKIVSLDEVKNDNDKESIYDRILDPHYFYVSSLNTIKHVDNEGDYEYFQYMYHNYKEDKIVIYIPSIEDKNKVDIIFYDLVNGEVADRIEVTDKDMIEYVYFTQWNEDGTVYFTVNYTSYKYNLKTKKLIMLGPNIYFPVTTPDGKYLIYSNGIGPDRLFSYEHIPHFSDQIKPGMYAKNLETGETIFMKGPGKWVCEGIEIVTIMNY